MSHLNDAPAVWFTLRVLQQKRSISTCPLPASAFTNVFRIRTTAVNVRGTGCLFFQVSMFGNDIGFLTVYQYTFNPEFGAFTRKVVYREGGYSIRDIEDTLSFWRERALPVDLELGQDVFVSARALTLRALLGIMRPDMHLLVLVHVRVSMARRTACCAQKLRTGKTSVCLMLTV